MRRRGDLQHTPVSPPKDRRAFADRIEIGQYAATIREELLALCGQDQTSTDVVEQRQAQLLLKIADLSGKRRLSNTQAHRRFRYAAQFSDCNEGFQAPRIHRSIVCPAGIDFQHNYALDGRSLEEQSRRNELALPGSIAALHRALFAMPAKGGSSWRTAGTAAL